MKTKTNDTARDHASWTWLGRTLVTCRHDGTIPLNSRVVLEVTTDATTYGEKFPRDLIAAAPDLFNAAAETYSTLARERLAMTGGGGVGELKRALEFYDKAMADPTGAEVGAQRDAIDGLLTAARKVAERMGPNWFPNFDAMLAALEKAVSKARL